jgi:hypothetical protein
MKKILILIFILASLLLPFGAGLLGSPELLPGQVVPVQVNSALYYAESVLSGEAGFAMQHTSSPDLIALIRPMASDKAWFFLVSDVQKSITVQSAVNLAKGANCTTCGTMTGLIKWMEGNGWKLVPIETARQAFGIVGQTADGIRARLSWLGGYRPSSATILVMPLYGVNLSQEILRDMFYQESY